MTQWEPSTCFRTFRLLVRLHIVGGLVLFFYRFFIQSSLGATILTCTGWLIALIGLVFQVLAMREFRKKGKAPHGKGSLSTTALIDSGAYALVRHPMYLAAMLMVLGSVLVSQHWLILIFGLALFAWFPIILKKADEGLIEKFGSDYEQYMQKVPSVNFLLGIIRLQRRNRERNPHPHG